MAHLIWRGIRVSSWRVVGTDWAGLTKTGSASGRPGLFGDEIADIGMLVNLERKVISTQYAVYSRYYWPYRRIRSRFESLDLSVWSVVNVRSTVGVKVT